MQPGAVHHREHAGQSPVFLANEPADGALPRVAIRHRASGAAVNAEFVFQRDGLQVVALAGLLAVSRQIFRHQEHGNAVHARRRAFDARQHHVHDVLGHGVVAPGDEYLLPENAIVVALRNRPRANCGQVRPGLGFGEIHGAGATAGDHGLKIARPQGLAAMGSQRFGGAHAEHGADGKAEIGGRPHFGNGAVDGVGQSHAAEFGVGGASAPAAFSELAVGIGESRRLTYFTIDNSRGSFFSGAIQRRQHVFGQFRGLFQNRGHQFRAGFLERRFAATILHTRQYAQKELHFLQWRPIRHVHSPTSSAREVDRRASVNGISPAQDNDKHYG